MAHVIYSGAFGVMKFIQQQAMECFSMDSGGANHVPPLRCRSPRRPVRGLGHFFLSRPDAHARHARVIGISTGSIYYPLCLVLSINLIHCGKVRQRWKQPEISGWKQPGAFGVN